MGKITKAVIPCGGRGTRFLPITKSVPKEILPVIDTPVLGHIVNEAVESGITDIMIVLAPGKEAIKDYFTRDSALEEALLKADKKEFVDVLKNINKNANFYFTVQEKPLGNGDAILKAEEFIKNEPFALAWGDDLIVCKDNPVMGQLIKSYEKNKTNILGVQTIEDEVQIRKYGVPDAYQISDRTYSCKGIIEKPQGELPSHLASLGRYVLAPGIFDEIRKTKVAKNGELQLTDTLNNLAAKNQLIAYDFIGTRYDMGDKLGSVKAIIEFAYNNNEYREDLKQFLKELILKN